MPTRAAQAVHIAACTHTTLVLTVARGRASLFASSARARSSPSAQAKHPGSLCWMSRKQRRSQPCSISCT